MVVPKTASERSVGYPIWSGPNLGNLSRGIEAQTVSE
jgi:hypothetical protein